MSKRRPMLIGITGGTGSGKSTVSKEICRKFDKDLIVMIEQDSYYRDQSHLSIEERVKTNYDHPNAFDTELLVEHLRELSNWNKIEKPIYDFELHNRKKKQKL
ncbi:uridine kinase [Clostridium cochlearium]|nr:uridine kinase [Clostridium cochlearium]